MDYTNTGYYITTSKALAGNNQVSNLLGRRVLKSGGRGNRASNAEAVVCWGKKPSAIGADEVAEDLSIPLIRLEDAFLRSLVLGHEQEPCGIVIDSGGIYYDAASNSDLFAAIKKPLTAQQQLRTQALIERWRDARVSKYNHCRSQSDISADYGRPYVLLIDQTFNDASIAYGRADTQCFQRMLASAKASFPDHLIVIKTHPDVIAGTKRGYFSLQDTAQDERVHLEGRPINPPDLLQFADAVFCVTSQMGFEALLWNVPVYTFGVPFYAGWGLTHDVQEINNRQHVPFEQLVHAALIDYARYWHPQYQRHCSVEELIDWIAQQRYWREQFPVQLTVERFPRWKRSYLQQFLAGSELHFLPRKAKLPRNETCVVWGNKSGLQRVRVEDGFVRSVGLGADLIAPKSWVFDDVGMYYDARAQSRLERLLNSHDYSEQMLTRAKRVRQRLIEQGVSKYNVGEARWSRPETGRKVVLVPGQVESDASVQFGSPKIKTNADLLQAVRDFDPQAYIVYKPHPDVTAGLRHADKNSDIIESVCDEQVINEDMAKLLPKIDEVHTMTSLTGFEALLRGIKVVCHGQPFYSGWGLTKDIYPVKRRKRQRTVEELVAAALIDYPRYLSRKSGYLAEVEDILDEIDEEKRQAQQRSIWKQSLHKVWRLRLWLHRF